MSDLIPVDHYFAERMVPEADESVKQFLANLLRAAREGHLCLPAEISLPSHLFEQALVEEGGYIYLKRNWECEKRFIEHYERLKNDRPAIKIPQLTFTESLEPEQREAIVQSLQRALSLICGGPGTGKTYTAATLIRKFQPHGTVVVAAPTGKAAANLRAALGSEVVTLHALLRKRRLQADLVVVDEASMIDAELMARLFASIPKGARLILIGDKNQLPPVETGNFFADLSREEALVSELGRCLRAELVEIVEMAEAVKRGEEVAAEPLPEFASVAEAVFERGAAVLTPLRHGMWGVNRLNQRLHKEHVARGGVRFPILIRVNDAAAELYNGDVGELVPAEGCAYFGERRVPEYRLPHYEFAYVLSVHKSQGSEYDEVVVLLPEGSEVFGREMLYTALTRAKKRVQIYAAEGVVTQVVSKHERRVSGVVRR